MCSQPFSTSLNILTCLLLVMLIPARSVLAQGSWKSECVQISDHVNQQGRLKEQGEYTHFVCTASSHDSASQSISIFISNDDIHTVFIIHGQTPIPENFNVIALTNVQSHQFAPVDQDTVDLVSEDVIETAVDQQVSFVARECGSATPFAYGFKSADRELLEKIHKDVNKQLKRFQRLEVKPEIKKKIPMAGYIADHWPKITSAINSLKNYLIITWPVVAVASLLWSDPLRASVATYEKDQTADFKDCLVQVLVDTNELFGDMNRQGVTSEHFTSLNTIQEISDGFDGGITQFQTTGRFLGFLDPSCACPTCPGDTAPRQARFTNCLVDVIVQTDAMIFDALRLTNSELDGFLNTEIPLSGYFANFNGSAPGAEKIVFNITSNTTLNTATVFYANFSQFDTRVGGEESTCSCLTCPRIQTELSKNGGVLLVYFVNTAVSVMVSVAVYAGAVIVKKIYRSVKG